MSVEEQLHEELLGLYRRAGEATGYWANRFLQAVRKDGGLAVAKKLLAPGQTNTGLDKLVEVHRADLSVEAIVLLEPFRRLFSADELAEAKRRLAELPEGAFPKKIVEPYRSPDEIDPDATYSEGTVVKVTVNSYERNPKARKACIKHHGSRCKVCDFDFEERYGEMGKGFIHVHHKRPLSQLKANYKVNPKKDLVPVCPNCHAMLHRYEPPLEVEQLRRRLTRTGSDDDIAVICI